MNTLYLYILNLWFNIPEKIRFLFIGGMNTIIAYFLFWLFYDIFKLNYNISLVIQYFIGVNISIISMRYLVFKHSNNFIKEYIKAWQTYIILLLANLIWLNISDIFFHQNPLISQLFYIISSTILTYILHKYYSFKS